MRKDIKCHLCFESEGNNLIYFEQRKKEKLMIYKPSLMCDNCFREFQDTDRLFEGRPVKLSFIEIARMDIKLLMWLCSDKGKEINDMATKPWRKKLLRIKKISEGRLKSPVYWSPMPV